MIEVKSNKDKPNSVQDDAVFTQGVRSRQDLSVFGELSKKTHKKRHRV